MEGEINGASEATGGSRSSRLSLDRNGGAKWERTVLGMRAAVEGKRWSDTCRRWNSLVQVAAVWPR